MTTALAKQGGYAGNKPFCNGCKKHHTGYCTVVCNRCGRTGHMARDCNRKAVAMGDNAQPIMTWEAEKGQGLNVVVGTFLINNRYASVLFDSGSDKSFVNTSLSHLIDIKPVRLNTSYEVELADGRIVSTNTVLRGYSLNLINHLFEIDLIPIELDTFDIVIGMDWLVEHDAVIVCGNKEVHIPVKNKVMDINKKTKTRQKLDKTDHKIGKSVENRSRKRMHLSGPTKSKLMGQARRALIPIVNNKISLTKDDSEVGEDKNERSKESSPSKLNLGRRNRRSTISLSESHVVADIEDDIMDPLQAVNKVLRYSLGIVQNIRVYSDTYVLTNEVENLLEARPSKQALDPMAVELENPCLSREIVAKAFKMMQKYEHVGQVTDRKVANTDQDGRIKI
ncbi:putative reverse transcriptase domain-containing protein [Tanacetum coccineum]